MEKADTSVVLDGKGIVEMGTHAQLMALGGLYRRLHTAQEGEVTLSLELPEIVS